MFARALKNSKIYSWWWCIADSRVILSKYFSFVKDARLKRTLLKRIVSSKLQYRAYLSLNIKFAVYCIYSSIAIDISTFGYASTYSVQLSVREFFAERN